MQPRLACADSTFPKLPHDASLAVIKGLGLPAADICVFEGYPHTPPATVLADPARAADAVRQRLEHYGLGVSDVFVIVGSDFQELAINNPDGAARARALEQFSTFLSFAKRLESPGITVLPGAAFDGVDERESRELAASELNRRAQMAGEAGLKLAFEPHYGSIAETPQTALELIELTPDVGFALDYSHFVYQGIPEQEVDPLLERTHHFHVRQAAPGVIQARTREGAIDFLRVRDRLLELGYDGYFAIEYQWEDGWLDFTRVDCVSETADIRDLLLEGTRTDNGGSDEGR
jgi:sugar phosphate isomerase/epimerase